MERGDKKKVRYLWIENPIDSCLVEDIDTHNPIRGKKILDKEIYIFHYELEERIIIIRTSNISIFETYIMSLQQKFGREHVLRNCQIGDNNFSAFTR